MNCASCVYAVENGHGIDQYGIMLCRRTGKTIDTDTNPPCERYTRREEPAKQKVNKKESKNARAVAINGIKMLGGKNE